MFFVQKKAEERLAAYLALLRTIFFQFLTDLVVLFRFFDADQILQIEKIIFVFQIIPSKTAYSGCASGEAA